MAPMDITAILQHWGFALVFGAVLLETAGLPLPSAPLLVVAGALSVQGPMRPDLLFLTAFGAALTADLGWFLVGRRYGRRLLETVCRISLSPDICVSRTDDLVARHGPKLLLFAKFIPGVSAVAIPTAAAMGVPYRRFLPYDAAGVALWCGAYIGAGAVFSREVDRVLGAMDWFGMRALAFVGLLLAIYVASKLLHRHSLRRLHRLVRISPEELSALIDAGVDLVIVDARSEVARRADPRALPRALLLDDTRPVSDLSRGLRDKKLVTFCTCPNEASAAMLAEQLLKAGHRDVRVLTGGTDALDVLAEASRLAA
jgi:membrane protein DedA with SNARE-associated domain/rhodanese-related sulfurtransferase